MQSLLFGSSLFLVILSHCHLLNGALSLSQCPDNNLDIIGDNFTIRMSRNGVTLTYIYADGFYPHPVKKRECYKGHWDPQPTTKPPVCKRSATRVCQANGKWSGGTPICSHNTDHCPDPGTPPGASRQGHIFKIDDKVTYSCAKNLKLIGSKVRVCMDGGYWSGREPECYADFTYDTPEEVAEAFSSKTTIKTTITMQENSERQSLKAVRYILHPEYNAKQNIADGISEYKENDVALTELQKRVKISPDIRTICIPCTQETNWALKLSASDATCDKHREVLLNNELVQAHFITHEVDKGKKPKQNVLIRQGPQSDKCIQQAANILKIGKETATKLITENFLCTGGASQNYIDNVICKGDAGGPTIIERNRLIQVGVISWGLKDTCATGERPEDTRDFHTNLFNTKVQDFLQVYLGSEDIDTPLHFL